jgi:UDP-N-acetylmuramyl pentapeptide phosphotransferase/UDP-N-acetylglucosamine-1-phosphate transferase
MFSFLLSFIVSALITLFSIKSARGVDTDILGVQKVHARPVPRIGGVGIFIAVLLAALVSVWRVPALGQVLTPLLMCGAVAFIGGLVEDYTGRVRPLWRLVLTMLAAFFAYFIIDARIGRIDGYFVDFALPWVWLTLPLTLLCVAGIANAINIIDGFNGLASVVTICMLLSLAYVAAQVGDVFIVVAALTLAGATAGFLIWNYPAGLIFLGDGGAYFLGFMLGELALLLVMRNREVSTWYPALLLIYPAFETLFSVYRRVFVRGRPAGMPDGIHLHSLIFRRLVQWAVGKRDARALLRRNSLTSPYLWLFSLMAVIPASLLWRHTGILMLFCLLFVVSYLWLYARIVRFRAPRWMILRKKAKSINDAHASTLDQ